MDVNMLATRATGHYPDHGPTFVVVSSIMNAIAGVLVVFRVGNTLVRRRTLVLEDTMVIAALAADVCSTVVGCEATKYGFGRHGKDIKPSGGDVHTALMYFFLFQLLYKIVLMFNKLSFLFLYYRVFQSRNFRRFVLATFAVLIAGTFSFVIVTVFQCRPIRKSWMKTLPGSCVSNEAFRWSWASWNTAMDLWVCLLPIPVISGLQMRRAQKFGVMIVFLLGLFVCVTSILRMVALTESVSTSDPTWGSLPALIWSSVEASTGLICACLPSLKQPIQSCLPGLFSRTKSGSRSATYAMDQYRFGSNTAGTGKVNSQTHSNWQQEVARHTTKVSAGAGTSYPIDEETGSRESQERIIKAGSMGGITLTTDIDVTTKADEASLGSDRGMPLPKKTYQGYQ